MIAFHGKRKKAESSVEHARQWFSQNGFTVAKSKDVNANGPDLIALKNDEVYRVEVKSASKTTRSWRTGSVKRRSTDDLVAIVFENGSVFVEPMEDHLLKCSRDGSRRITKLAAIYA